jgi:hypothetical protein
LIWTKIAYIIKAAAKEIDKGKEKESSGLMPIALQFRQKRIEKQHKAQKLSTQHNAMVAHFNLRDLTADDTIDVHTGKRRLTKKQKAETRKNGAPGTPAAATDEDSEGEEDDYVELTPFQKLLEPFDPDTRWRRTWDVTILVIVCFQLVYLPYVTSFDIHLTLEWKTFDFIIDCIFITDMVLTFNVA